MNCDLMIVIMPVIKVIKALLMIGQWGTTYEESLKNNILELSEQSGKAYITHHSTGLREIV